MAEDGACTKSQCSYLIQVDESASGCRMESAMAEDGACTRECDEQLRHIMSVHVRQFTAPKVRRAHACPQAYTSACANMLGFRSLPLIPDFLPAYPFTRN